MRIEGRPQQVTQFQPINTVSDAAQADKPQNAGSTQAAVNSQMVAKDQFSAAKNAAPVVTNQARTGLQVPDTLRRPDRSSGDPHVGGKMYPCTTDIAGGTPLEQPGRPVVGDPHVGGKMYPCTTDIAGGTPLEQPGKPVVGEKVTVGEKMYPPPRFGEPEPVIGQRGGPKPGFEGSEPEPVIGQRGGPKPGFGGPDGEKVTVGEKIYVGEPLGPKPGFEGSDGKKVTVGEKIYVGEPLGPKPGFEGFGEKPAIGEKLGPKPGHEPEVYYGTTASSDTEIKVPEPERKPEPSPWGKAIPEPKYPDMWNDDLGQRNR